MCDLGLLMQVPFKLCFHYGRYFNERREDFVAGWSQHLHFHIWWTNCCAYVSSSLHFHLSFCSSLDFSFILPSLLSCQGAIICNLPKSSICWDTKRENEVIWCKRDACGHRSMRKRVCARECVAVSGEGPGTGGGAKQRLSVKKCDRMSEADR